MASTILVNRDRSPLTREQLANRVPSILADRPHDSRSARYLYIPTVSILDALAGEGFAPVYASESRSRDASRRGFTKHIVRLARPADRMVSVGDTRFEVVITNSHDGPSAIAMNPGVYRLACLNGLEVPIGENGSGFKVRHSAKYRDEVIEGTYKILDDLAGPVAQQIDEMTARTLTHPERLLLAEHATSLRWADAAPVAPVQMLTTRRAADREPTAWNTLNVLQENAVRGGLRYRPDSRTVRQTRPITGIDDTSRINRGIWDSVATLATGDRVGLAASVLSRLSPEELDVVRAQLA